MVEENNPYAAPQASESVNLGNPVASDSPYGPMRNTGALSITVRILLGLQLTVFTVMGAVSLRAGMLCTEGVNPFWDYEEMTPLGELHSLLDTLYLILFVATVVVFCIWKNKSMKNAWAMRERSYLTLTTPRWAVGYYFVPIVLMWKPFQAMKEIWEMAFHNEKSVGLLRWWWGFWLLDSVSSNVSTRLPMNTLDEIATSSFLDATTSVFSLIAGVLLIMIVGQITKRQMEAFTGVSSV